MHAMSNNGKRGSRLREKVVRQSVAAFDWGMLESHLRDVALDAAVVDELLGLIRRNKGFVIKGADAGREAARADFSEGLRGHLATHVGPDAVARLTDMLATTSLIESGYGEILRRSASTEAARLLPEVQASAALRRAALNYHELAQDMDARTGRRKRVALQGLRVTRDDGSTYSPDGVLAGICKVTAMVLHLLGQQRGWFDGEGRLTLPEPTEVGSAELDKAGLTEMLAVSWRHWERLEQRCRFFGGRLAAHHGADVPRGRATRDGNARGVRTCDRTGDPRLRGQPAPQRPGRAELPGDAAPDGHTRPGCRVSRHRPTCRQERSSRSRRPSQASS